MDLGTAVSLLLVTCVSYLMFISMWRRIFYGHKLPPGPTPLPIVGNILQVKGGQLVSSMLKLRDIYGPVFTVYLGPRRVVVLCSYDVIKEAYIDQADDFVTRGAVPAFERVFRGYGIGVTNGEEWKQLRRFTISTMKNFGTPIDASSSFVHASSNVILHITMGERFNYEDKIFKKLLNNVREGFHIMSSFWGQLYEMFSRIMDHLPGPHQRMFKLLKYLEDFITERVENNQKTLDLNNPRDYIDCFLIQREKEKENTSSVFTIMNLVMTVMDIILGAMETTTATTSYGLLALMKHPEIQAKLQEEIDNVTGEKCTPTFADRGKMPYTKAVIAEIQRCCDILPMGAAHAVTRDTPFREFVLPKGTNVFSMLTTSLNDPKYFSDPKKFNPGHFLDENGSFKKVDAFMPFAFGKRSCPGEGLAQAELFLFFSNILKNFYLKSPIDLKDVDLTPIESGFENVPPTYKICFIPRKGHSMN
ncbi:cytochrome P450 2A13-like isoform X2 [Pleurodeles waltl]|uniref:cytochrome P450 2A13-like isoform X2 n=1 Tax=Pleurodeles waltl TaxID=8319 RepID=UPI00370959E8